MSDFTSGAWSTYIAVATLVALLACGLAVIVTNYLGLLPGNQQNRYLLIGLVEIADAALHGRARCSG